MSLSVGNIMKYLILIVLVVTAQGVRAGDINSIIDASRQFVGSSFSNGKLLVGESCPDPKDNSCTTKVRYFSAATYTTVGNIQQAGNLTERFDVSIAADFSSFFKRIKFSTVDDKGFELIFFGDGSAAESWFSFVPVGGIGKGGYQGSGSLNGWKTGSNFNEIKISVQDGGVSLLTNGQSISGGSSANSVITLLDPKTVFTQVSIDGIRIDDRLKNFTVSGMKTLLNPNKFCMATPTYSSTTGKLLIPCIAVMNPSDTVDANYSIEMQQRSSGFTFDLDLNKVKQK